MESERGLWILVLMRFLDANRHPLRSKTLQQKKALEPSAFFMSGRLRP
jgi:hypothetical protein